jgi:uncharacterized protein
MSSSTAAFSSILGDQDSPTNFYIPQFEVRVEGVGLPRNVLRDVKSISYTDNINQIDGFSLEINNWDPERRAFKYVGSETAEQLENGHEDAPRFRLFEPCNKQVEIRMGYSGELQSMLRGTFTSIEPSFTASAAPTLTVRGLNVLHKLRTQQNTEAWTDARDSDVAQRLRARHGTSRFPIPIVIDSKARNAEPVLDYISQRNQYDIDFLLMRARERGYVVYLLPASRRDPQGSLYFGPRDATHERGTTVDIRTYELAWGKSLIEFKPTLTTANQVRSVRVEGWNRRTRRVISHTAHLTDARISCNRNIHRILQQCDPREEIIVNQPVCSPIHARRIAEDTLDRLQHSFVKCTAKTIGLPDLRAGMQVMIGGVGERFSGRYFITESTHTIDESGYLTSFKAQRDDPSGRVRLGGQ